MSRGSSFETTCSLSFESLYDPETARQWGCKAEISAENWPGFLFLKKKTTKNKKPPSFILLCTSALKATQPVTY